MYCAKCGSALVDGAAFCGNCGQRTGDPVVSAPSPPTAAPAIHVGAESARTVAYAGFWLRFVALIIDKLLLGLAGGILALPFMRGYAWRGAMIGPGIHGQAIFLMARGMARVFFLQQVLNWLYYALMESSANHATLGKMALGLEVTSLDGQRISFGRATGRHFGKIVSALTIFIGYLMAGFTKKKQALHDIIAGCLVIKKE